MTPENMLTIADEFCRLTHARVRDYGALVAIAAIPNARIHGAHVYDTTESAATALKSTICALTPLTSDNEGFAQVTANVYRRFRGQ